MKLLIIFFISISLFAEDSALLVKDKADCAANIAMEWSSILNRCVDKVQAVNVRNAAKECDLLTDLTAKKNCQMNLARKDTGLNASVASAGVDKISSIKDQATMINGAYSVVAAINMIAAKSFKDPCTCKNIFAVTAMAGIASDLLLKDQAKKKMEAMANQYTIDSKTTAYNSQLKALQYLRDEQKAVADLAAKEEKRQMLLEIGYGVAAAYAVYETISVDASACYQDSAQLAGTDAKLNTTYADASKVLGKVLDKLDKLFLTPPGIIIAAGIGTLNSNTLRDAAAGQKAESEANATKVDAIIKTFTASWVNNCPNGRDKLEEPDCYCYLENGSKNPGRTNSQICVQNWATRDTKFTTTPTDYSNRNGTADPVGCVAVNGQFDQNCQCKKLLDAKGNNACMQTSLSALGTSGSLGVGYLNNSGMSNVVSNLNGTALGSSNLGSLSGATLAGAIAKQKLMNSQLYQAASSDPAKSSLPILNSNADILKAQNSILSPADLGKLSSTFGGSAVSGAGSSGPTGALAVALKEAKKTAGLELTGGQGLNNKKTAKPEFNFNFADNANAQGGGAVTQNFMDKNYNLKQNDIVKKPESSIFEIISNRYLESGLRRLFEDK
jgi:hypothetical protein